MLHVVFLLKSAVVIFSLLAGGFWIAAATNRIVSFLPWKPVRQIPLAEIPTHQAKFNARAAICASIAAVAQAVLFLLIENPPT